VSEEERRNKEGRATERQTIFLDGHLAANVNDVRGRMQCLVEDRLCSPTRPTALNVSVQWFIIESSITKHHKLGRSAHQPIIQPRGPPQDGCRPGFAGPHLLPTPLPPAKALHKNWCSEARHGPPSRLHCSTSLEFMLFCDLRYEF
jgi:hypothetical protein